MKGLIVSTKIKTALVILAAILLLYSLLGFFIIPAVLLNQAPKIVSEKFNCTIQIEKISFNPFSMEFNLQNLRLSNLDTPNTFLRFDHFYTNIAVLKSIYNLTLTLDKVELDKLHALIQRNKQGNFNFTDLLNQEEPKKEQQPNKDIFPVKINQIIISEGKLDWEDNYYSTFQKESISPLNLAIDGFTTLPSKESQLGFSLSLVSGGTLDWKGSLELNPLNSEGQIKLDKINFHKVWQLFLQDSVNFKILSGSERIKLDYHLVDTDAGIQLLVDKAQINLHDLKLSEKNKTESLISIPNFDVSGINFDLLKQTVSIKNISAKNANFKAWLNKGGEINYQALFASNSPKQQKAPEEKTSTTDKPWAINVDQINMDDFSFNFVDNTLTTPAHIDLTSINLNTKQISNKEGTKLPFDLSLKLNGNGLLNLKGNTVLSPFSSDIKIDASTIALKKFQPYIDSFARLDIISGLFNINAQISMKQEAEKPFDLKLKGNSHISHLITRDQITNKDFLKWKKLSLNKIDINLLEKKYIIDLVKIDTPYTRVLIRKDKSINVNDVIKSDHSPKDTTTEKSTVKNEPKEESTTFKITTIEIIEGVSDFSDRSLILPFSAHINHLKGSIKGVSSDQNALIKVALNGKVANLAPVNIKGSIAPNKGNSNISLNFKSMPLPLMTPYMAEFAGRKIEKGNMSLSLKYKIKDKKLTASNNLLIDQLVLGDEVKNPDATSLPLGLAIALLEDSDGKIKLDMPITGSLDDPQFSVGSLIFDTLVNVLTKIVASPFNAIASLIDSDEDISKIIFSSGESLLNTEQQKKLDGLAKALSSRPALILEIKGTAFSKEDWPHLQIEALEKQLLAQRVEKLNKNAKSPISAEQVTYSEEENKEILADLFIQKFPELADRSLLGTPRLTNPELGEFYEVAQTKLAALILPNPQRLQELATKRAQTIAKYLTEKEIPVERVFLLNVAIDPEEESENTLSTLLNLTTN